MKSAGTSSSDDSSPSLGSAWRLLGFGRRTFISEASAAHAVLRLPCDFVVERRIDPRDGWPDSRS